MSVKLERLPDGNTRLCVPLEFRYDNGRKRLFFPDAPASELEINTPLVTGLARGYRWQKLLDDGEYASPEALATALGVNVSYVRRHLRYTLLAPQIIEAILDGKAPWSLSLTKLDFTFPWSWQEQGKRFGVK